MENFDYTNWQQEREILIDDILRILREQEDLSQNSIIRGNITFNPQVFIDPTKQHLTLGPILFGTQFDVPPDIFYEQKSNPSIKDYSTGAASSYSPYLVTPYTYDYSLNSGSVDGFYLGLYAPQNQTVDPTLKKTTVSWMAVGIASRYKDEGIQESWTNPVDYNEPGYLVDNE